jgi:hypothetical protein
LETIDITLPVTRAAAERLREPSERSRLGALLSMAIASAATPGELVEAPSARCIGRRASSGIAVGIRSHATGFP